MMGRGTFLELLELAAIERGLRAKIELFSEGEFTPEKIGNCPVARIRLSVDFLLQLGFLSEHIIL
jgi:hypothetical protein